MVIASLLVVADMSMYQKIPNVIAAAKNPAFSIRAPKLDLFSGKRFITLRVNQGLTGACGSSRFSNSFICLSVLSCFIFSNSKLVKLFY